MSRTEEEPNVSRPLPVIICPGFHQADLTAGFVRSLPAFVRPLVVDTFCVDALAIFRWMTQSIGTPTAQVSPVVAIGFSGGVVGIAGALKIWQQQNGRVSKLIAIDGWGMPLLGLPVCRLSHDSFTHWSSLPLGAGDVNFYADPSVDHLRMWGEPKAVSGYAMNGWERHEGNGTNAAEFIAQVLKHLYADFNI